MTESNPRPRSFWAGWIAAGVFFIAASVAGVFATYQKNQLDDVELRLIDAVNKLQMAAEQNSAVVAESDAIRTNLAVLSDPDTVLMTLTGKGATPDASARVFLSRTKGVLFAAAKLKPLGGEEEYQLWLQTKAGPVSVAPCARASRVTSRRPSMPSRKRLSTPASSSRSRPRAARRRPARAWR